MVEPTHLKKYESNWIISPGKGKNKRYLKPPPSFKMPRRSAEFEVSRVAAVHVPIFGQFPSRPNPQGFTMTWSAKKWIPNTLPGNERLIPPNGTDKENHRLKRAEGKRGDVSLPGGYIIQARWFKPWSFYPLVVGGLDSPLISGHFFSLSQKGR